MNDLELAQQQGIAPWTNQAYDLDDVIAYYDAYPVTPGHMLFVPKYNTGLGIVNALKMAYQFGVATVMSGECSGFNVGLNHGISAGQTVMYPHVHMIPRRDGDMEDPRGGVRHVIPSKGNYRK